MDLPSSGLAKQEDAKADPAIMLFGKQIKSLSTKDGENIKEELSPRGVDEKGLSFATSSDDEEDLNPASEDAMHVKQPASPAMGSLLASETAREHVRKRKSDCIARDKDQEKQNSNATECVLARMGGEHHSGKLKGGIWSRCPRCNSADTKFCYFNNYNVNQPRHFCKNCQRYWTAGGTLRNVPIGAGKRKNKHALPKPNFVANSTSALPVPIPSLPMEVPDPGPLSIVKSDPLPTPKSDPLSMVKVDHVNTNLELSAQHSFTDYLTQSLPPCNIVHPQCPHKVITLQQLHENLHPRLSQFNHPHLATGCSKLSQMYPSLACGPSTLSPNHPELAGGCSKLSQIYPDMANGSPGLSQRSPFSQNGSYGLSPKCPDLCSGSSSQICPDLQSGSSRLCHTCPHEQSGFCKTSQRCPDSKRNELSGLAKSDGSFSDREELKGDLESEVPKTDQKSASLEKGLLDLAKNALEMANLECKASSLQLRHPEIDPNEVDSSIERFNEMKPTGCNASNECKDHMRGEGNGLTEVRALSMCLQDKDAQVSSTLAHMLKSQEAFNLENSMKRGVGEGHNGLPLWGSLWPCFYNMFWLDPLAFPHFRPILTPQGWALPFIPPSATKLEPTSNNTHNHRTPTTYVSENFESSSTLTTSSTPTTFEVLYNGACNIGTTSLEKHSAKPPLTTSSGNFEDVPYHVRNITTSSLRKRPT